MFCPSFLLTAGLVVLTSIAHEGSANNKQQTFKLSLPLKQHSAYGRIHNAVPKPLEEFTFCHWVRFFKARSWWGGNYQMFTYSVLNETEIATSANSDEVHFYVSGGRAAANFTRQPENGEWMHLCFTWSAFTGVTEIYENGWLIHRDNETEAAALGHTIVPNGVAVLGQYQSYSGWPNNTMEATNYPERAWKGDISEVHLWDEILCPEQIAVLANCSSQLEGNVVSWNSNMILETFNGATVRVQPVKLCQENQCSSSSYSQGQ